MSNPYFRFKQFTIWHDQCAMRVNTDGVLLGSWVSVNEPGLILDIGTGTGIIALMLAQRTKAFVHAVEIEENAWKQAKYNIEKASWQNRIEIIHDDFCNYYKTCSNKYDLVITNPPYFSNSLKSPETTKTLARHNDSLSFGNLLQGVSRLLNDTGIFAVILPADTTEFENEAFIYGLKCSRRMMVRSLPDKKVIRQLLEFRKSKTVSSIDCDELTIHQQPGVYSPQYIDMTKDFYLIF